MSVLVPFNRNRRSLSRLFDEFFNDDFWPFSTPRPTFRIDVRETNDSYLIEAELPGVSKEEIDLQLTNDRLTINVNRQEQIEEDDKNYIHRERRHVSMSRTIYLDNVKIDGAKAKLDQGILTITIPKQSKDAESVVIDIE
ncbi:MAG TPA: Hsp20/alpha crystallin family protein [Haloplasmataceae bacterium]